jgi:hypothetical protein
MTLPASTKFRGTRTALTPMKTSPATLTTGIRKHTTPAARKATV